MKKATVLMVVENFFPRDTRVRKEADSLKSHYDIFVIALKMKSEKFYEKQNGIQIYRIPELPRADFSRNSIISSYLEKLSYMVEYLYFTICSTILFLITFPINRYKVIHVHNPPDSLFLIGILGKIFFVKFIFDHHDLSPELYLSRFSGRKDILYRTLLLFEKISCKLADVVISTNNTYKKIVLGRHGIDSSKMHIVRNDPIIKDYKMQTTGNETAGHKPKDKIMLFFLGAINPQDGLDVLLKVLHYLVNDLKRDDFICYIAGDGDSLPAIKENAKELGLLDYVDFKGYLSEKQQIIDYLISADICLEPAPFNELNKHSTFIKIMEYMASAKPIVAFDLEETRFSSNGSAILIEPVHIKPFAEAIAKLMDDPELRKSLGNKGHERIRSELNWNNASLNLIEAYKGLSIGKSY